MRVPLLRLVLVLTGLCAAPLAQARSAHEERYPTERVWNAAVRMLRVDLGFEIVERDRDAGFLLFTWRDGGRNSTASLELMPAQVEGVPGSRVVISIANQPMYTEQYLLTRLGRKLREDYGEAPVAPRAPAPPPLQTEREREHDRERGNPNATNGDGPRGLEQPGSGNGSAANPQRSEGNGQSGQSGSQGQGGGGGSR